MDVTKRYSVERAAAKIDGPVDVLINCAGVASIQWMEKLSLNEFNHVIDTNARGIFVVTQALLPWLLNGTICNIISNAAHLPMRCSLAYNASKAAALMMSKQMARELGPRHNITIFSVSPNRLAGTDMSNWIDEKVQEVRGWSAQYAREYQLAAIPAGVETPVEAVAEFIAFLLSTKERHKYLQGNDMTYGGPV